ERQRIVLARVFARHPKILILDEATSALDNESEATIKNAIYALKGEITIIAIAHRLSTIMNADRLIVLENGKVIEEGIPSLLLKEKNSYFYRVYNIIQEENV
ncbi:ABC transporter ATP-binding protein, partial [Candidatus Giovannonibacteria bacterium]|nr:ABC transporter ATP-binding protein [Candidatus Giovannonibacteria bacterium]